MNETGATKRHRIPEFPREGSPLDVDLLQEEIPSPRAPESPWQNAQGIEFERLIQRLGIVGIGQRGGNRFTEIIPSETIDRHLQMALSQKPDHEPDIPVCHRIPYLIPHQLHFPNHLYQFQSIGRLFGVDAIFRFQINLLHVWPWIILLGKSENLPVHDKFYSRGNQPIHLRFTLGGRRRGFFPMHEEQEHMVIFGEPSPPSLEAGSSPITFE